jgi:hypothetical protein
MNRTEQLELLATAFISEVATVCEDYGDAGEAVLAAKIEDAKATFVRLCKERHTQAVSGKGLWGLATTTYAYMAFFKKAEKWLPKLIEGAAMVAMEKAEAMSVVELQRLGLERIRLDGALCAIIDDALLEEGL